MDDNTELIDLSHVYDSSTLNWVGEVPFSCIIKTKRDDPLLGPWFQTDSICTATHAGTHMDAPLHFSEHGWDISQIPTDRLILPAVVVDISSDVGDDPNVHLRPEHLQEWERRHGPIPPRSLLFIRTGWSKFWPNRLLYTGTETQDVSELKFPALTPEAGKWIADNKDVYGIGIDTLSVDVPNTPYLVHQAVLGKNIYILENVNNLEKLPPTGSIVYALPMNVNGVSGAPTRVLARIPK